MSEAWRPSIVSSLYQASVEASVFRTKYTEKERFLAFFEQVEGRSIPQNESAAPLEFLGMARRPTKTAPLEKSNSTISNELFGTTPIPNNTNIALGLGSKLENFANTKDAISLWTAWDKGYHRIAIQDVGVFRGHFGNFINAFTKGGGRVKFNLTGLNAGIEGVTTWELRQILRNNKWRASTDFFRDGERLTDAALEEALGPWL